MESTSGPNELPSPSSLGRLIATYVQQSAEQHELRAHKALNILHQKDVQLARLQKRLAELEHLKLTMSQSPLPSQDPSGGALRVERSDRDARRRDLFPAGFAEKSSRVSYNNAGTATSYPTRQIKSNFENVSEGSNLTSSSGSEETKSQPNLQSWHNTNEAPRIPKQNNEYVPDPCGVGQVSEKIQYYERPGCGDVCSRRGVAAEDADRPRGLRDAGGVPPLDLPTSSGTEGDVFGAPKCRLGMPDQKHAVKDDFVQHFLDVKLMEASIICQEMKRDASRPGGEHGKAVPDPETSVLYCIQNARKSAVKSCSSESVDSARSSRSRSRESLKDAGGGAPLAGAQTATEPPESQHRRLIDHLMLYNRELKAELADVQTRAAQDREMHTAEVLKLQQCVSEIKESMSAEFSPPSAKQVGATRKSTLFSRNVSSQTEGDTIYSKCEEQSCASVSHEEDDEPKGTSRTTQTEHAPSRGCLCGSRGDSEMPPQWLLAEAVAHANWTEAAMGTAHRRDEEVKSEKTVQPQIEVKDAFSSTVEICTKVASTQVDLSDSKAKDKTIEEQESDIAALQRKVDELSQDIVNLGEASRRKLEKERKAHQRIQFETEKKMINFCNIVAGDVEIPCEFFSSLCDEKSGDSSSGNSSRDSQKAGRRTASFKVQQGSAGSRWDVQAMRRYVKTLKGKLRVLKTKNDRAAERIAGLEQSLELKVKGLTAMEKCVEELLSEVTLLRAAPKMFEDGTGDGGFPGDKVDKQCDNARTQNVHTRLRNVNQQLVTRSRTLLNLQQEMKEMQNNMQNMRNRLSRSETLNQNKQLIIENYKRRLEELASKEVATATRNSGLTTENHHLKDVINNLKKQISQLQSGKSLCTAAESEPVSRKLGEKVSSEKLFSNRSEDDLRTLVDFDRMKCSFETRIEEAAMKLEKAERRLTEFRDSLERFLRSAQTHFASQPRAEGDADADANGDASTAPRLEARALACSILNLTHGQLDTMLGSGAARTAVGGDSQLLKWLDECERLYSSETFAEKLASHLLEILKKLASNSRG